jgi:phospholipase C
MWALRRSSVFAALLFCTGCAHAQPGRSFALGPAGRSADPLGSHVVVIVMENAEYGEVIGARAAPYVTALAHRYGVASASFAMTHPSLPNYLALTSGSTHGISSDCTSCSVSSQNIVDQLERAGLSWRAYMEDLPRPCFTGAEAGGYAKKHDPFAYYRDIVRSPTRCGRIRGFGALASDLRGGHLPAYAWITPNLCNDGHDCGVAAGDRFLARTVPSLLSELGPDGLLLVTWDEGGSSAGCCGGAAGGRVATVVAGPLVRPSARDNRPVDDYGVLGTIEEVFGLSTLGGAADARSGRLSSLFSSFPHIR